MFGRRIMGYVFRYLEKEEIKGAFAQLMRADLQQQDIDKNSIGSCWTFVHFLVKHKEFRDAMKLIDTIKDFLPAMTIMDVLAARHRDMDTNAKVLSCLIGSHARKGMLNEAIDVFNMMGSRDLKPDVQSCNAIIMRLGTTELPARMAWNVYNEMLLRNIPRDARTFLFMIHICKKTGNAEGATKLLKSMERNGFSPDVFVFNKLLALYSKKRMLYQALSIENEMCQKGMEPTIETLDSMLLGFCRVGRMTDAMGLYNKMGKEYKVVPILSTFNILIDGHCKAGNVPKALQLWDEMIKRRVMPDIVTYNILMRKLLETGKLTEANGLLNEIMQKGFKPSKYTLNTLVWTQSKRGSMHDAVRIFKQMQESEVKPDFLTYKSLIKGFCKINRPVEAIHTVFEMIRAGYAPNYRVYAWLVDMFCKVNKEEEVLNLPAAFVRNGIPDDTFLYCSIIRALCKNSKLMCAEKGLDMMVEKGLDGDAVTYGTLFHAYLKIGEHGKASRFSAHMKLKRLFFNVDTFKAFIQTILEQGCKPENYFEEMISAGVINRFIIEKLKQYDGIL